MKNILGLINANSCLIDDEEPSYQIQEFALQVFEAFRISQIGEKTDEEKKELFFTDFDKILNSTDLKTNKNLKDEIYDDLISDVKSHLSRIETGKRAKDGRGLKESGVRVRTAPYLQDNETDNKIDSIQIRLLIYDLRHRSEQQTEGSPSSFGSGWPELLPILTPEITAYFRLLPQIYRLGGLHHTLTQNTQAFFQSLILPAAESKPLPEAIYASKVLQKPSFKLQEEPEADSEPPPQPIPAEDAKRDKVAEFKKFLHDNNLHCNQNDIQKVFALHELYEAYKPNLQNPDEEIQEEISITPENLEAFKNQISELIFKKELSGSPIHRNVTISLLQEPRVKLDPQELEEILTFLNKNQESEKIDNSWEILNLPFDLHDESKTIIKNVELFKENKKVAITEKIASWYPNGEEDDKIQEAFIAYEAYEAYANATSIQDKQALKAIILTKLTLGNHQDVSKNLEALAFLKILDELNKYHTDSIARYQKRAERKAKQEKPNEIIKFFFEDLPNTIFSVFDCTRTNSGNDKGPE